MIELLRSEWIKFRTVRGWVIGIVLAPLLTVGFGALTGSANQCGYSFPVNGKIISGGCSAPTGPDHELVQDSFYFAHQELTGNGTLTARLTGITSGSLQPWAKTGIIVKASTVPGSAYAAMMLTGAHGVRLQWNYTHDVAGMTGTASATSPRWLRLVRAGDTLTGYDSADGAHWTKLGTATLTGLPATVQAGLFASSPSAPVNQNSAAADTATGTFDNVTITGDTTGTWTGTTVDPGPGGAAAQAGGPYTGYRQSGTSAFTVTGMGDISPDVPGDTDSVSMPISHTLDGTFIGLIVVIVIGAIFVTAEYRRGMIKTTFTATPARGQVLAAKAIVIGGVTFVAALIGCVLAIPIASHQLHRGGVVIDPVSALTFARVAAGTAAVYAGAAILAVALGVMFRRGVTAVTTGIALVVVPYFLAVSNPSMPATLDNWLMRVFPAAALAVQGTVPRYPQVESTYLPFNGYFPLTGLAGFAVLIIWAGGALWLAARQLRRADA